ncbi:hypothetical protein HYR54_02570 [Candidatus Acetothermia bacterium]|nr:hypothetical protein [Candidatus Acetothermia bacterium]
MSSFTLQQFNFLLRKRFQSWPMPLLKTLMGTWNPIAFIFQFSMMGLGIYAVWKFSNSSTSSEVLSRAYLFYFINFMIGLVLGGQAAYQSYLTSKNAFFWMRAPLERHWLGLLCLLESSIARVNLSILGLPALIALHLFSQSDLSTTISGIADYFLCLILGTLVGILFALLLITFLTQVIWFVFLLTLPIAIFSFYALLTQHVALLPEKILLLSLLFAIVLSLPIYVFSFRSFYDRCVQKIRAGSTVRERSPHWQAFFLNRLPVSNAQFRAIVHKEFTTMLANPFMWSRIALALLLVLAFWFFKDALLSERLRAALSPTIHSDFTLSVIVVYNILVCVFSLSEAFATVFSKEGHKIKLLELAQVKPSTVLWSKICANSVLYVSVSLVGVTAISLFAHVLDARFWWAQLLCCLILVTQVIVLTGLSISTIDRQRRLSIEQELIDEHIFSGANVRIFRNHMISMALAFLLTGLVVTFSPILASIVLFSVLILLSFIVTKIGIPAKYLRTL